MSKAYDFLKNCNFYYLLTLDSDYPAGRPISGILEADGVMYFGTKRSSADIAESRKKKQEIQNVLRVLMDITSPPGLGSK